MMLVLRYTREKHSDLLVNRAAAKARLGRAILRLIEATGGQVQYKGIDLLEASPRLMQSLRKDMQIIFQDPYSSLNPRYYDRGCDRGAAAVHGIIGNSRARKEKVLALLEKVDLRPEHYHRYPHEFSGGQRQRIVIARRLALEPSFVICDESVSALDVSVQAQVLNLLNDLKKEFGFTAIFISHDLSVVKYQRPDHGDEQRPDRRDRAGGGSVQSPGNCLYPRLIESIPKINFR
jgi:peptide/nickel transport system ATP-binding protein